MRVVSRQVTLGWSLGWWSLVSSQATLGWNTHRNKLLELSILSHNSTSVESSQVEVTFQKHTDQWAFFQHPEWFFWSCLFNWCSATEKEGNSEDLAKNFLMFLSRTFLCFYPELSHVLIQHFFQTKRWRVEAKEVMPRGKQLFQNEKVKKWKSCEDPSYLPVKERGDNF